MENKTLASAQDGVEKIAKIILWTIIGITILVVALFALVGYDTPYEEKPTIVDPQMTDLLLIWTGILIGAAAVVAVVAIIYGFTNGSNKSKNEENGFLAKTGLVSWGTFVSSLIIGVGFGIANKDEVLIINGKDWNVATDIIMADASIVSIAVLIIATVIVTVFSMATANKK